MIIALYVSNENEQKIKTKIKDRSGKTVFINKDNRSNNSSS